MELDLNKELEVLLRRAREGSPSLPAGPCLDPDTISAFAANAVPAAARPSRVSHFADCERCRVILSEIIKNAEAEAEVPACVTSATPSTPWYKTLFEVPRLSWVTAMLFVIFGGIAVVVVMQNQKQDGSEISKAVESPIAAPSVASANTMQQSESKSGSVSTPASEIKTPAATPILRKETEAQAAKPELQAEAPSLAAIPAPPPPTPAAAEDSVAENEFSAKAKRKAAQAAAPRLESIPQKSVKIFGGKTLENRNGVWTDVNYSGQTTVNVRRNSEEFNKLDSELRSIANSVSGTVIIVWGGRAYRFE